MSQALNSIFVNKMRNFIHINVTPLNVVAPLKCFNFEKFSSCHCLFTVPPSVALKNGILLKVVAPISKAVQISIGGDIRICKGHH